MKSSLGYRALIVLALFAATMWPRVSRAEEAPKPGASSAAGTPRRAKAQGEEPFTLVSVIAPGLPPAALALPPRLPPAAPALPSATVPPPPPPPPVEPGAIPAPRWYDIVKVEGFVDAYASMNANSPKPASGQNSGRAFDVTNGVALHWVGLNATYVPDPVGATVNLRFGPGAVLYNAGSDDGAGLSLVKQAFVGWRPLDGVALQLDFGKFDTWIGSDIADSQYNMNYTRSALFTAQPYFHTGVRADMVFSEQLDLKLYAVNGYNNSVDNNASKSFGTTVGITPMKELTLLFNYIGGPEQSDLAPSGPGGAFVRVPGANRRWRHLGDLIADVKLGPARVLLNADYGTEKLGAGTLAPEDGERHVTWFGGNLTFGYTITDLFAVALRGGYLGDPDGYLAPLWGAPAGAAASVVDAALTLSVTPTPHLMLRLEPRIDVVGSDAPGWEGNFPGAPDASPSFSKTLFTTTLGVVATTN
jgi:hypothetical protein